MEAAEQAARAERVGGPRQIQRERRTGWDGIARYLSLLMIIAHPIRIHTCPLAHSPTNLLAALARRAPPPPARFPRSPSGHREGHAWVASAASSSFVDRELGVVFPLSSFSHLPLTQPLTPVPSAAAAPLSPTIAAVGSSSSSISPESRSRIELRNSVHSSASPTSYSPNLGPLTSPPSPRPSQLQSHAPPTPPAFFLVSIPGHPPRPPRNQASRRRLRRRRPRARSGP